MQSSAKIAKGIPAENAKNARLDPDDFYSILSSQLFEPKVLYLWTTVLGGRHAALGEGALNDEFTRTLICFLSENSIDPMAFYMH